MRAFRFLHTADLHLGTPFRGLQKDLPPSFAVAVSEAADNVMKRIVDIAIEHHVDFVTIAGDLFDTDEAGMFVQFELMRGLERLEFAGIPVFMIHGNHDPLVKNNFLHWPGNVHVFDAAPPVAPDGYVVPSEILELQDGTRIQISGFSYGTKAMYTPMAAYFSRDSKADFAIGLYHGLVGQEGAHANYCPAKVEDLERAGFDVWGLGHIHKPQVIRAQNPLILYPGNPQGRHIREDGLRGCSIIDVLASKRVEMTFVPVSTVLWDKLDISVDGCETIEAVRRTIIQHLSGYVQQQKLQSIVRLAIGGQTEAHGELDEQTLRDILQEEVQARHWPIYIEQIDLLTFPALDEEILIHSNSYAGTILRLFAAYESELDKVKLELLPELEDVFHSANGFTLEDLTNEQIRKLLQDAKRQLAGYLVSPTEVEA